MLKCLAVFSALSLPLLGLGQGCSGSVAGSDVQDQQADDALVQGQAPTATAPAVRDVLLVGNSVAGTVSFIDATTFESLGSVNVYPDRAEMAFAIYANPIRAIGYTVVKSQQMLHHFEPGGGDRYVDDVFVSPDGRTLYVSRSNLGDVAAFDLSKKGQPRLWHTFVAGFKADHAAMSPDGTRLVVSATSAQKGQVFDAKTGKEVGSFSTGYYPHQNDYSADGQFIYNSSIGNVGYNAVSHADNDKKGDRWLVKVDAQSLKVVQTWKFDWGIRPNVISADGSTLFTQLSYLNGLIKYDLVSGKEVARSDQALSDFALNTYATYDEYPHDSAHHGLALSGDGKKLCDCGTIDNTVTILSSSDLSVRKTIDVGLVPYWATTSPDGRYCFVSLSGDDAISVIDYQTEAEVENVPTGKVPQRSRLGRVPASVVALLNPSPS
jgi:YVTN family beta-propeller protein